MTHNGISRRSLLGLLAWWVGLGASPLRALAADDSRTEADPASPTPLAQRLLRHRRSAVAIGRRFLRERPDEATRERLIEQLGLPSPATPLSREETARQGERLREVHRRDHREGRVAEIGGWVLPLTELRLAALLALETEPRRD